MRQKQDGSFSAGLTTSFLASTKANRPVTYGCADPRVIHWYEAKPFHIVIGIDPESIPDVANGWRHLITQEVTPIWNFPILSPLVTGQHPGRLDNKRLLASATTSGSVCNSPRSEAKS